MERDSPEQALYFPRSYCQWSSQWQVHQVDLLTPGSTLITPFSPNVRSLKPTAQYSSRKVSAEIAIFFPNSMPTAC